MSGIAVNIRDQVRPLLALMKTEAGKQGLTLVIGRAVANKVKAHLIDLNAERHKFGRNYYAQASRGTTYAATPQGAVISVQQIGIQQRLRGGTITPNKPGGFLTLPAAPEAYGTRAREFHDLSRQLVQNENGRLQWALVRNFSQAISFTRRKRKDGTVSTRIKPGELRGGEVVFWLVRKVTQKPDLTVLPSAEVMIQTGLQAAILRINRLSTRGGQLPPETSDETA